MIEISEWNQECSQIKNDFNIFAIKEISSFQKKNYSILVLQSSLTYSLVDGIKKANHEYSLALMELYLW